MAQDDELEYGIVEQPHMLTREEILASKDVETTEIVPIPEWGGAVKVRGLSLNEVSKIVSLSTRKGQLDQIGSAVLTFVRGVVEPKFTDMDFDDLKKKNAVIMRAVKAINRLSGMTDEVMSQDDREKN